MTIDFEQLYLKTKNKIEVIGALGEEALSTKRIEKFWLSAKNPTRYIKIIPYRNDNDEYSVLHSMFVHSIPEKTIKYNTISTSQRLVPCEAKEHGEYCRFCEVASKLRAIKAPNAYLYLRQQHYYMLGTELIIDNGQLCYQYVGNEIKTGIIVLQSSYNQLEAYDIFMNNLEQIPYKIDSLVNFNAKDIFQNIISFENSYVLTVNTQKIGYNYNSYINLTLDTNGNPILVNLPSSNINVELECCTLDKDIINKLFNGFNELLPVSSPEQDKTLNHQVGTNNINNNISSTSNANEAPNWVSDAEEEAVSFLDNF